MGKGQSDDSHAYPLPCHNVACQSMSKISSVKTPACCVCVTVTLISACGKTIMKAAKGRTWSWNAALPAWLLFSASPSFGCCRRCTITTRALRRRRGECGRQGRVHSHALGPPRLTCGAWAAAGSSSRQARHACTSPSDAVPLGRAGCNEHHRMWLDEVLLPEQRRAQAHRLARWKASVCEVRLPRTA